MCGEKPGSSRLGREWGGSPPHVRGKARIRQPERHEQGITPACAGKRWVRLILPYLRRDHPRMCGEKTNTFRREHLV